MAQTTKNRVTWRRIFDFKLEIPSSWSVILGLSVWVLFFGFWAFATWQGWMPEILLPGPAKVLTAIYTLFTENNFLSDVLTSVWRVMFGFGLACAVAVPLSVLMMGSFKVVEAFFSPSVSAWRYLPAPSFIPLLLRRSEAIMEGEPH